MKKLSINNIWNVDICCTVLSLLLLRECKAAQDARASQQNREVKLSSQLQPALPVATITEAIMPCAPFIREPNQPACPSPFLIVRKDQWTVEAAKKAPLALA